jgi:hypothetical protein
LDGRPVGKIPDWPKPSRALKDFLRTRPHLRELHALGHLGVAFGSHLVRRATGHCPPEGEDAFRKRYA